MNRIDAAKAAFNLNDPNQYEHYADDFQWSDASGSPPMDKSTWLAMAKTVRSAFPDLSLKIDDIREVGDQVAVTSHFTGTFTNAVDLSAMGMGTIPPTGKRVEFPKSSDMLSFEGDKVSRMHNTDTGPDSGMAAFMTALGVAQKQ
jgi:predicted ester cyclase